MRMFPIIALLFLTTVVTAQPLITVTDGLQLELIGRQMEVLVDETGTLSLDEVQASQEFKAIETTIPNLGLSTNTFWLRTRIANKSSHDKLKLVVQNPEVEYMSVHVIYSDRTETFRAGQTIDPHTYKDQDIDPTFQVQLRQGAEADVYMKVRSNKQLLLPVILSVPESLAMERSSRDTIIGLYMGIMLVLLLYNLFIYASTHDRNYLIYVLYIALAGMTQLVFFGYTKYYFWPENIWFSLNASVIFTVATGLAANEFMYAFIRVRDHAPMLGKGRFGVYAIMLVALSMWLSNGSQTGYQLLQMVVMVSALYQFIVSFIIARKGSRQARYFLAAWSVFLLGIILFVLKDMQVIPYNNLTKNMMPLGTAIEGILLSLALADRINILRREKEQSQAESLEKSKENERIIREQNVILEDRVKERTHALEESNENLKLTQTQLVNAEKMASLGQLTAGIAHEINNPINFITSNIKPLRRNISEIVEVMQEYRKLASEVDLLAEVRKKEEQLGIQESIEELDDIINSIAEGSSRTAEIVRGLRNFSRLDESDLKDSDINEGIRNTITVLAPQFRDRVRIEMDLQQIPAVECFPGKVNQVFMNILTNAVQATIAKPGEFERTIWIGTHVHGDHVIISIKDNGIGMNAEVKARIYDPFFTKKPVGEGTGLGMAIVYGIIEDHHGSIEIDTTPGMGAEFRIALPIRHLQLNERRA